jgi:hypothetical protein
MFYIEKIDGEISAMRSESMPGILLLNDPYQVPSLRFSHPSSLIDSQYLL